MRILMLGPRPNVRGPIPKHAPWLVAALRDLGCDVILQPWGRRGDREPLAQKLTGRIGDIRHVRRVLTSHHFDVLVIKTAHDWATMCRDIPLLLASRGLASRLVLQFHGSLPDRLVGPGYISFKAASTLLLRLSDAGLVLSSEEQRQWQSFYPAGKFYVVQNPFIPAERLPSSLDRRAFELPEDKPVVLFVGRVIEAKGIFELLAALPQVLTQVRCHLLIVGDGPQAPQVRQRLADLRLSEHVTMAGYLEGEALGTAYGCADVFVLPSWTEGFAVSITEAMDAGLPVVTTRIRGMADHLQDGTHGFLVPPRDTTALAGALKRLLADPALRARMAQTNKQKVQDFAPPTVGAHYLSVLQQVVAGGTAAPASS